MSSRPAQGAVALSGTAPVVPAREAFATEFIQNSEANLFTWSPGQYGAAFGAAWHGVFGQQVCCLYPSYQYFFILTFACANKPGAFVETFALVNGTGLFAWSPVEYDAAFDAAWRVAFEQQVRRLDPSHRPHMLTFA